MVKLGSFPRGIHPADHKGLAAEVPISVLPLPKLLRVPVQQHIGAPSAVICKPRTTVAWGDVIAEPASFVSAAAHAPVAGTTAKEVAVTLANARHMQAVPVKPAKEQPDDSELWQALYGGDWSLLEAELPEPDQVCEAIRQAGIVGMGGAAFPTHVKLTRNAKKPVDTVLVNGCECEPFLTADYRLMLEAPAAVVAGARLAARACGAERIVFASETTKPRALDVLRQASAGQPRCQVMALAAKYPMGGEKQTVRAAVGRTIPTGGLPLDVGVVVINVGTCAAIAAAVMRQRPMTHRIVTVSGAGIVEPKNILAPVGAAVTDLIAFCGGLRPDAGRVVSGGPMMGFALGDLDVPITKGTSGLTVLSQADLHVAEQTTCIRCGRCVQVCPLNLVPNRLGLASRHGDWDLARRYQMTACMECGCCAYGCPAGIPLVQLIRSGKARLPRKAAP